MQCFVINLEKDRARREQIAAQLQRAGLAHEIFPAVYGKSLTDDELLRSYDVQAAARLKREMTTGEIGCALSHQGVYKTMVERGLPCAMVLEDDALLGADITRVLAELEPRLRVETPQVVLLNCVKLTSYFSTERLGKHHLLAPVLDGAWGAHGYVLNLAAAKSLLAGLFPVRLPADIWDQFRREKLTTLRAVVPYCVGLSDLAKQSSLGLERCAPEIQEKRAAESGWAYLLYRYVYRKFIYQLIVRPFIRKQGMTW